MLLLKLMLTPLIIAAVTLIGRRYGPRAAGLVVGLPVTAGPISVFLAREQGVAFASRAAVGTVTGLIGTVGFCAAFALTARRRSWAIAFAVAAGSFAVITMVSQAIQPLAPSLLLLMLFALAWPVVLWTIVSRKVKREPKPRVHAGNATPPVWDLPMRVLISTTMVAALTAAAGALGSRWTGAFSALPVFATVLGIFTFRQEGPAASIALMRGLMIGSVSGVLFFGIVGAMLAPGRVALTYALASAIALIAGAIVSHGTKPRRAAGAVLVNDSSHR